MRYFIPEPEPETNFMQRLCEMVVDFMRIERRIRKTPVSLGILKQYFAGTNYRPKDVIGAIELLKKSGKINEVTKDGIPV